MQPHRLVARARRLIAPGRRRILGITGPPGAGKSTLAAHLVDHLGGQAVLVPMDGFHLAGAELDRLGRTDRKGAPDTFDAAGYVALLTRLRAPGTTAPGTTGPGTTAPGTTGPGTTAPGTTESIVYAPAFDRALEEPVAGSIAVPGPLDAPLVITEGNYLLLDEGPWAGVRDLLDEVWFVDLDQDERVRRLIDRHERFGKPRPTAERFVHASDEANARLVEQGRDAADLVVTLATG